jgi:2'-hydroxyisoflavone reductase
MRLLVLGGTVFLSKAVAADAVARGHDVTCACRGTSGSLPDGVRHVAWDRAQPAPPDLVDAAYDAVVDVARHPSYVRRAVEAVPGAHWVFVSTINVYADDATPGGRPGALPLRDEIADDVDLGTDPEAYGGMKVACERIVTEGAASSATVRPGLIVGPGDPTGRFSYWPRRLAAGGEVLAPGSPDDTAQVIDVRDLAAWIVTLAEQRVSGAFDGIGESMPLAELLDRCATGVGAAPSYTWVGQDVLQDLGVQPWMGEDAIPLWLPRPEYDGLMAHDVAPSLAGGLTLRPLAATSRDTLAWLEATPDARVSGISRDREAELLALAAQPRTG